MAHSKKPAQRPVFFWGAGSGFGLFGFGGVLSIRLSTSSSEGPGCGASTLIADLGLSA